jgi:hypothetical protein
VDPSAETRALFERIQTEELAPGPSRPAEIEVQLPDWLTREGEPLSRPGVVGRGRQVARLEGFPKVILPYSPAPLTYLQTCLNSILTGGREPPPGLVPLAYLPLMLLSGLRL